LWIRVTLSFASTLFQVAILLLSISDLLTGRDVKSSFKAARFAVWGAFIGLERRTARAPITGNVADNSWNTITTRERILSTSITRKMIKLYLLVKHQSHWIFYGATLEKSNHISHSWDFFCSLHVCWFAFLFPALLFYSPRCKKLTPHPFSISNGLTNSDSWAPTSNVVYQRAWSC